MKKAILVVPFMVLSLGVSSVYADAISQSDKQKVVTQIRSIADIDRKIKEAEEYLEKLPAELDETKEKFRELASKGDKIEEDIATYLTFMDTCSTHELKHEGGDMCDAVMNASIRGRGFQEILNDKRNQIQDAINFISSEIATIEEKMKETGPVRDGIKVLKKMKKILTFDN